MYNKQYSFHGNFIGGNMAAVEQDKGIFDANEQLGLNNTPIYKVLNIDITKVSDKTVYGNYIDSIPYLAFPYSVDTGDTITFNLGIPSDYKVGTPIKITTQIKIESGILEDTDLVHSIQANIIKRNVIEQVTNPINEDFTYSFGADIDSICVDSLDIISYEPNNKLIVTLGRFITSNTSEITYNLNDISIEYQCEGLGQTSNLI